MSSLKDLLPIKTSRLLLRMLEKDEAHLITAYVNENREHLRRWEPIRSEGYYNLEFWEAEIKRIHNDFFLGHALRLCIFLKRGWHPQPIHGQPDAVLSEASSQKFAEKAKSPEGPIIGVCNFTNILRGVFQACFLGYSVDHKHQGQGIMYEALKASTDFVFKHLKLHRIMANYMPRNEKSGKLLRKLGFVVEGFARDYLKINGQWEDHILTSKIA
jgi:ribosomal-protein-alanine N-acetyltransferase